jgi:hypothetical protein
VVILEQFHNHHIQETTNISNLFLPFCKKFKEAYEITLIHVRTFQYFFFFVFYAFRVVIKGNQAISLPMKLLVLSPQRPDRLWGPTQLSSQWVPVALSLKQGQTSF